MKTIVTLGDEEGCLHGPPERCNFIPLLKLEGAIWRTVRIHGFSITDLQARSRGNEICDLRSMLYLALREIGFSTTAIGRVFNRTHSNIVHVTKNIKSYIDTSDKALHKYNQIRTNIRKELELCN